MKRIMLMAFLTSLTLLSKAQTEPPVDAKTFRIATSMNKRQAFDLWMKVNEYDREVFDEIFHNYETEVTPWDSVKHVLMVSYSKNYTRLAPKELDDIVKDINLAEAKHAKVRDKYYGMIMKRISSFAAGRFYQIDNYMESAKNVRYLETLPYMKGM